MSFQRSENQIRQRPWLTYLAMVGMFITILCLIGSYFVLKQVSFDVAAAVRAKSEEMQITTEVRDFRGRDIGVFSDQTRFIVPYKEIPKRVRAAFIAAEDSGFFNHIGVSPKALIRALAANIKKDRYAEGGSTITQQLVRQLLLSRDKTLLRKFQEVVMALTLERQMAKQEILELWLNSVYLGNNAWGVEAAARHYFNKPISKVSLAEAAMIAGLPQAPSRYAPHVRFSAAQDRQRYVLNRLKKLKRIKAESFEKAVAEKIQIAPNRIEVAARAPWVTESVRLELWRRLEQKNLPKTGLVVNTTIDRDWQLSLQSLIKRDLKNIRRDGLDAAAVVLDAKTGDIRAMVGGTNFYENQFNRAFDLYRPYGAAVYPIVFAWGVEKGLVKVDGYASIAEAAVRSRFAEAEQIAPEIGYGLVRDKLMGLGFVVKDAMAIDEMHGSPLNIARAFLGISGARQFVPRGMVTSVLDSGQSIYSSDEVTMRYSARIDPVIAWVVRKWMAIGSTQDKSPLAGEPAMKSVKGWNSWWIIPRRDVVVAAWIGADSREPDSPNKFKQADARMDKILSSWIQKNLSIRDGVGAAPEGISYMVYSEERGQPAVRVPFVSEGQGVF
jgi:penicillin-binding protein 1A